MRFLALVFACLALGPPLIAQDSSAGPFTLNSANQCAEASVQGRATVVMYVSGTFSMTLQPKVAIQGQSASNTQVTPSTSTTAQSTITATGNYRADVAGQDLFQLCATSVVSGSAVIYFKMTGNISTGLLGSAAAASSVNSVSGTASQIDSTGGNNPVLSLDPNLILPSASTATTQTSGDTSASVATDAFVAAAVGGSNPPNQLTQLLSGGGVEWTGTGYIFTVGGATYLINGTQYTTTLTQSVTLAAADATNDRIDWIILNTTGTATYVEGVAATPPLAPFVDPATQLALQFVYVAASTTSPSKITRESIYVDNTQWTGTRSPATTPPWTLASTNNPYTPASNVDIEATTAATGNFVQYLKPAAGTVDLGTDTNLIFYIRSKAAWPSTRSLAIQWLNGSVARCTGIILKNGLYNFNSSNTTSYQQVSIPTSSFNCSGISVTQIRFTVSGTGTNLGFYLANVLLQGFPQAASTTKPGGANTQVQFNSGGLFGGAAQLLYDTTDSPGFPTIRGGVPASGSNLSEWDFLSDQSVLQVNTQVDASLTRPFGIFGGVDNPQASEGAAYGIFGYAQTNAGSGAGIAAFNAHTEVYGAGTAGTSLGDVVGMNIAVFNRGTGSVPNVSGLYVYAPGKLSSGAILNAEGITIEPQLQNGAAAGGALHIENQGAGYGIKVDGGTNDLGPQLTTVNVPTQVAGTNNNTAASTAFVANGIAGVNPAAAVQAATTIAGDTSTFTYLNGVAGIGATLTGPTNNVAVAIDGFTFTAVGQRLLVKNDTQSPSGAFNGVYSLTVLQGVANKPVLTRALDYDMPSDINNTGAIPVINGTANGTTQWVITSSVTTVGTDPLTYAKFSSNPSSLVTNVTGTSPVASSGGTTPAISLNANGITATQLAAQYSKGSCTEVWGGSGASNAMASGDDAIVNNSCYNDSAVTRTITAVKCRSDNAANTTVLTPTFGSAGTGTAILTGTVTCGNSYAYSATGTLTNTAWTTGTGIDPGMSTVGNATSIALIVEYTF